MATISLDSLVRTYGIRAVKVLGSYLKPIRKVRPREYEILKPLPSVEEFPLLQDGAYTMPLSELWTEIATALLEQKIRPGDNWTEVAERYHLDDDEMDELVERVAEMYDHTPPLPPVLADLPVVYLRGSDIRSEADERDEVEAMVQAILTAMAKAEPQLKTQNPKAAAAIPGFRAELQAWLDMSNCPDLPEGGMWDD